MGAGGKLGGGGKGGAREQPDTLRSRATITSLFLLGEGEMYTETDAELEHELRFNDVPYRNPDGTLNFDSVRWAYTPGTQDQGVLPGFGGAIEAETEVNQTVRRLVGPTIRYVANDDFDGLRLRFQFSLIQTDDQGNIIGARVEFTITIQDSTGAYITRDANGNPGASLQFVDGKAQSYERTYFFELDGVGPWRVRVERLTEDSTTTTTRDDMVWASFTGIIADRYRYPNSALFGVEIDSEEFESIPAITLVKKGLLLNYPHNYDPTTRTYTGFFDGSFSGYGFSDNPAWVLLALLQDSRFGVGDEIPDELIDPYTLYEIGQFCDELVSDGMGGTEPRFTCNAYIDQASDAQQVIDTLVSVFRGMSYYFGGQLIFKADVPTSDFSRIYTKANTLETRNAQGQLTRPCFVYEGTAGEARHTAAQVEFIDKDNQYIRDTEYYENSAAIARYGFNLLEIRAFATTSRSQARRVGAYAVLSELNQSEIVRFRVGSEGYLCQPTEIIAIADPHRMGSDRGGRVQSCTTSQVTLDRPVEILANRVYTISLIDSELSATVNLSQVQTPPYRVIWGLADPRLIGAKLGSATVIAAPTNTDLLLDSDPGLGNSGSTAVTFYPQNISISRMITNGAGTHQTLDFSEALTNPATERAAWILSDDVQPEKLYRVLQVLPRYQEDRIAEWEITAIEHDPTLDTLLEDLERPIEFRQTRRPTLQAPQNVSSQFTP